MEWAKFSDSERGADSTCGDPVTTVMQQILRIWPWPDLTVIADAPSIGTLRRIGENIVRRLKRILYKSEERWLPCPGFASTQLGEGSRQVAINTNNIDNLDEYTRT
jgi:hypothetical protein